MRIDQTMFGQDFELGIDASVAAATHTLSRPNGTSIEPRTIKKMARLNIIHHVGSRSLLKAISVSGYPLLLNPGPGTVQNVLAGSAVSGFPGRALDPTALVDRANLIGCYAGPNSPVELEFQYSDGVARTLSGGIGTDQPDELLLPEVIEALDEGDVYGEPNFGLGGGEVQQANANTAETITVSYKSPRRMYLERLVVDLFKTNGAVVIPRDFRLTRIAIAGTPLLSTAVGIDCLIMSPFCSDEDGLQINVMVNSDDTIELDFACAAFGAGVSGIVQHGFFTS